MSDEHHFQASVTWPADPAQKRPPEPDFSRNAILASPGHEPFAASSPAVYGGEPSRWNPEELLAASLAHCHMLTYLAVAAKRRLEVIAYEDHATATLAKGPSGKLQIVDVLLRPKVRLAAGADLEAARALHDKAHDHCFISNSVNFPVRHEPTFETG
jgi:organic hydroperoxide reductase OsmC/OhrA